MAVDTYWDSSSRDHRTPRRPARRKTAAAKAERRTAPWWLSMLIVGSIFSMLCISINLRAYSAMSVEVEQNTALSGQIQNLIDENLALQEEIHMLKTSPELIRREAKKIGIVLK